MASVSDHRRTALITGATAGIGAAFARRLASDGYDVVLVARDKDRLASLARGLANRHQVRVESLSADLSCDEGQLLVTRRLRDAQPPVDVLINNAGIGLRGSFLRNTIEDETRMLRLNVEAVLRLTHACLPRMTARGYGAVINVSSVAGFGPVASGSTYAATKAWVTNFSQSVGQQAARYNVRVMALCPGLTRTEFHERAGIDTSGTPGWLWSHVDDVVATAIRDLALGRSLSIPDWKYKAVALGVRVLPYRLLAMTTRRSAGRDGPQEN